LLNNALSWSISTGNTPKKFEREFELLDGFFFGDRIVNSFTYPHGCGVDLLFAAPEGHFLNAVEPVEFDQYGESDLHEVPGHRCAHHPWIGSAMLLCFSRSIQGLLEPFS
jgi:hypothetical protein